MLHLYCVILYYLYYIIYIKVKCLISSSFNLLNKAALLLSNDQLTRILPLTWELLLENENELSCTAGE